MTTLDQIYRFFQNPPPFYLNKELAVCYVLAVLLEHDSYGTELIQLLETEYPSYRLSDTVLYSALKFLEDADAITGYWKKVEGRGRPRRMYQITSSWRQKAQELASLWSDYAKKKDNQLVSS
ncbi:MULTISPECIES: PadR family transcriptional regulator [unclassified Leptolyngbya]|uniref:PadR family transcriptional regulator n=1 Tax=unclassified Leptolyngbya TaxID=2650499 RepID=UPI0016845BDA|nr:MULTISPECIES: PadR family transcriptional regulator [unclassified Leptolyngbya]MBD1912613.1 helix-turn-helix transcriptional regulator [Leptolyngbya sp. FACHB-8]MBD2156782.1 helix-turn-helix transcriptional regulator [Leptolyngbya sp. FACHB-16]